MVSLHRALLIVEIRTFILLIFVVFSPLVFRFAAMRRNRFFCHEFPAKWPSFRCKTEKRLGTSELLTDFAPFSRAVDILELLLAVLCLAVLCFCSLLLCDCVKNGDIGPVQ